MVRSRLSGILRNRNPLPYRSCLGYVEVSIAAADTQLVRAVVEEIVAGRLVEVRTRNPKRQHTTVSRAFLKAGEAVQEHTAMQRGNEPEAVIVHAPW
jgi:hypothetical protein